MADYELTDGVGTKIREDGGPSEVYVDLNPNDLTDLGGALADADLLIVDQGAGDTIRKSAMSRVWTYIKAKIQASTDLAITILNITGATDIGADLQDADEFIVYDAVGGVVNRKATMARFKTYIDENALITAMAHGACADHPTIAIVESVGVVSLELEDDGGGDLRFMFSDGIHIHDCTPTASVALTEGSDTGPTLNYVYILQSTKALTKSTVGWPATEYAPIATVLVQSAASVATDGAYKVHQFRDHYEQVNNQGHISDINHWIRHQHATWESGVVLTPTAGAGQLDIATTVGVVLQLHHHSFPVFNTATGDEIYVVNDPDAAYTKVGGLTIADGVDKDANGVTLGDAATDFYNLVIWGVVSEESGDCKLYCNVPDGAYPNDTNSQAQLDLDQTAIHDIPDAFKGAGFLIARLTVQEAGGTYTVIKNTDLRRKFPSAAVGGGPVANSTADEVTLEDTGTVLQVKGLGVDTAQIAALAVETAKIAAGAVTIQKLSNDARHLFQYKSTGDEVKNTDDVLADDDDLVQSLPTGVHHVRALLFIDQANVSAGFKVELKFTGAAVTFANYFLKDMGIEGGAFAFDSVNNAQVGDTDPVSLSHGEGAPNGVYMLEIEGLIEVAGAGNLALRWAQATSTGDDTTLKKHSHWAIKQF